MPSDPELERRVQALRAFQRFFTARVGALQEHLLQSEFSLTQVRLLWELAHRDDLTSAALARELALDAGYLSRLLAGFEERGFLRKTPAPGDARQRRLVLTPKGRRAFAPLDRRSSEEVSLLLARLPAASQDQLVAALQQARGIMEGEPREDGLLFLREHRPGDLGWVVHRQAALYFQEYAWGASFEALLAEIAAKFLREFVPERERCFIAERAGRIQGSVCLVQKSKHVAQLRMLYVEPEARGLGLGHRLVEECIRFARQAEYRSMVLWTNDVLHAARRIYEQAGFRLIKEEPHEEFGQGLVGQYWELDLKGR